MQTSIKSSLGVLELERGLPPGEEPAAINIPGSMINPATYDFPVILETVPGAWTDVVVPGEPALAPAAIAAAKRLVERGAVVISANCGFFIRHQAAVAAAVEVPVVLSSLLLVPMLLRQLSPGHKLAVLTFDSRHCAQELLGVDDASLRRIVVGGIEGGRYSEQARQRPLPPPDVDIIEADVLGCILRLRKENPEVAAILFECTAFPMVAAAIRRATKLPVYDISTLCALTIEAVRTTEL